MDKATEQLDEKAYKAKAKKMTIPQLWGAILDIRDVLSHSDRLDRELGGNRGGWYRDEASVYHAEMKRRQCG